MFRVVRVSGTPPAGDPSEVQTPIPGLRVEIVEEVQTTPVAIHEVLTDKEGRPLTEIQVDSSSEITIQSVDEKIAKFAAAGPASEFADPLAPAIVATPMIEAIAACRSVVEGTPIVEFRYNNLNDVGIDALVPITGLSPDLYGTPETPLDDLQLNSVRSSDTEVIPDVMYRGAAPNETKQLFVNGENTFRVPYDTGFGPLTWSFIGKDTLIDSSSALCEGEGVIRCEPLSPALIERLVTELRGSVSGTLRTASKVMKLGRSPYLKSSARAIRDIRRQANDLLGSYVCPQGAMMPQSCRAIRFPASELQRTHAGIFSKPSPVRPAMFEKLGRTYNRRYQRFLDTWFPKEIVVCGK
jgi:hypothetical protein